jgi:hypothetical protein
MFMEVSPQAKLLVMEDEATAPRDRFQRAARMTGASVL